jgi:hypothetical protein
MMLPTDDTPDNATTNTAHNNAMPPKTARQMRELDVTERRGIRGRFT